MRLLPSSLLLLFILPACGDDPDPVVLGIRGDRALLLAARQADDPWQLLTADASGAASFEVDRPFELVGACEDFGGEIYAYTGGPEDGVDADPHAFDIGCGIAVDAEINITTTSEVPLRVFLGFGTQIVSAQLGDTAMVTPGRHDIGILDDATGMLAIRRNVELTDGMTLDVDLTGAQPLVERRVVNVPETATVQSWTYTANGTRIRVGSGLATGWTMAAGLAVPTDKHYIAMRESDGELPRSRYHTVKVELTGNAPLDITLPPFLATATLTWNQAPSATFDSAGQWDQMSLFGYQTDDDLAPLWYVHSYPHAARTAGALAAPTGLTGIPGWKAQWNADASLPFYLSIDLSRETADGAEGVAWWLDVPPAQKAGARQAPARDAQPYPTARAQRLAEMRP